MGGATTKSAGDCLMEWGIALAIIAGNTITVLLVQIFGNRKQKA